MSDDDLGFAGEGEGSSECVSDSSATAPKASFGASGFSSASLGRIASTALAAGACCSPLTAVKLAAVKARREHAGGVRAMAGVACSFVALAAAAKSNSDGAAMHLMLICLQ